MTNKEISSYGQTSEQASAPTRGIFTLSSLILLPLLGVAVVAEVIARTLLGVSLHGSDDLGGMLLLLFFLSALPMVSSPRPGNVTGHHLTMCYFYDRMNAHQKRRSSYGHAASGGCVSVLLMLEAILDLIEKLRFNERSEALAIPMWPVSLALVAITIIMTASYVAVGLKLWREGHNT